MLPRCHKDFISLKMTVKEIMTVVVKIMMMTITTIASCGSGQGSWYSDSLRPRLSAVQVPVGRDFPAPVQTGPRAHPASYTMGTGVSLRG